MWPFHCSRCTALEARIDAERDRHTKREDALLNRVLAKSGAYPILDDELVETEAAPPAEPPPGLDEVYEQHVQWGREAGKSDYEIRQAWEANKGSYIADLGMKHDGEKG